MSSKPFYYAFNETQTIVPYDKRWENGTGYLDHAVRGIDAPALIPGSIVKTTTSGGRKVLLIGTRFGNAVIFERYTNPAIGTAVPTYTEIIVGNVPHEIAELYLGSAIGTNLARDDVTLFMLLGDPKSASNNPNVGMRIETLFATSTLGYLVKSNLKN